MAMWDAVELIRFRRLEGLKLPGLRRFNLLVGRNNSGKTSVLEALSILCNPLDVWTWIDTARMREIKSARTPPTELLRYFFPQTDSDVAAPPHFAGRLEITSTEASGTTVVVAQIEEARYEPSSAVQPEPMVLRDAGDQAIMTSFRVTCGGEPPLREIFLDREDFRPAARQPQPRARCGFVTPVSHRTDHGVLRAVSRLVESGGKGEFVRLLRLIDPQIEDLEIVSPFGRGAVVKLGRQGMGFMPLSSEGDGLRRALLLAAAAYEVSGGMLLLDEVETALHVAGIECVLRAVFEICRRQKIQVFATTHSLEALDAAVAALDGEYEDLAVFKLPAPMENPSVKRLGGLEAARMRSESGFDLR
jgi:energy-coupling factor transporter ATP-binding protein EcfA2